MAPSPRRRVTMEEPGGISNWKTKWDGKPETDAQLVISYYVVLVDIVYLFLCFVITQLNFYWLSRSLLSCPRRRWHIDYYFLYCWQRKRKIPILRRLCHLIRVLLLVYFLGEFIRSVAERWEKNRFDWCRRKDTQWTSFSRGFFRRLPFSFPLLKGGTLATRSWKVAFTFFIWFTRGNCSDGSR